MRVPEGWDKVFTVPKRAHCWLSVLKWHSWSASGQEDKSGISAESELQWHACVALLS